MSTYNPRRQGLKDGRAEAAPHLHKSAWNQAEYDKGYAEGAKQREAYAEGAKQREAYEQVARFFDSEPVGIYDAEAAHALRCYPVFRKALENISGSYPKTEEGETLAGIARDALAEVEDEQP